jgi:hypothetical protein
MYTGWNHLAGRIFMRPRFSLVAGLWLAVFAAAGDASKIGATNWSSLVLVGHPPPVAPQPEDYLAAHLLQSLGSRKLRVSFWGGGVTARA